MPAGSAHVIRSMYAPATYFIEPSNADPWSWISSVKKFGAFVGMGGLTALPGAAAMRRSRNRSYFRNSE